MLIDFMYNYLYSSLILHQILHQNYASGSFLKVVEWFCNIMRLLFKRLFCRIFQISKFWRFILQYKKFTFVAHHQKYIQVLRYCWAQTGGYMFSKIINLFWKVATVSNLLSIFHSHHALLLYREVRKIRLYILSHINLLIQAYWRLSIFLKMKHNLDSVCTLICNLFYSYFWSCHSFCLRTTKFHPHLWA